MNKRHCKRCDIENATTPENIRAAVDRLKTLMPENEKCPEDMYIKRLESCAGCDRNSGGTCLECGCFVEIRALQIDFHCPGSGRNW